MRQIAYATGALWARERDVIMASGRLAGVCAGFVLAAAGWGW